MKKISILSIIFIANFLIVYGQEQIVFDIMVFDRFENETISYAEIGFKGKDWGGISDNDGYFKVTFANESLKRTDTLVISAMGYYDWVLPSERIEQYFSKKDFVLLTPVNTKDISKTEVGLNKTKIIGGASKNLYASVPLDKVMRTGSELASHIRVPYDKAILQKVIFQVSKNTTDSVQLRLKIYDLENGVPNKAVLKKSINHWVTIREGRDAIDISKEKITVANDIGVSLQLIGIKGETGEIALAMSNDGGTIFSRYYPQSNWIMYPALGMAYEVEVAYNESTTDSLTQKDASEEEQINVRAVTDGRLSAKTTSVSGKITVNGESAQGVRVKIKGSLEEVETNMDGEYAIHAAYDDILEADFFTLKPKSQKVGDNTVVNFQLEPKYEKLKEVIVTEKKLEQAGEEEIKTALGKRKSRSLGYGVTTKNDKKLSKSATSLGRYLAGQFPGLIVSGFIGQETYEIRGQTSILFDAPPLFIVDGVPFTTPPNFLDPNTIENATVINGLAGTNKYGTLGRGGVIIIETKNSFNSTANKDATKDRSALVKGNDYSENVAEIENASSEKNIDKLGESNTNITLLKTKAMFYDSQDNYVASLKLYKQIVGLRPDRAQSYLDLARTLVKTEDYKKAFGLYKQMLSGQVLGASLDADIIKTVMIEVRHLATKHKSKIPYWELPTPFLEKALNINTRIVFDWNVTAAPFEIQFVNPDRKYSVWNHTYEENEDRLLNETEYGYQTEQFLIEELKKGSWLVNLENKSVGDENFPVYIKCTVYRNYGSAKETISTKLVELSQLKQKVSIAKIEM